MTFPSSLRIELANLAALKPNPDNARTHSDRQITQIATSIERFGFLVPIVIDENDMIAAGHGRWAAARKLALDQVPVVRAEFLTDADRRAFALAENRIAELSGWDDDKLAAELHSLFGDGYDIEITGFSTADLDFAIDQPEENRPEAVELPDPDARAITRPGDLWLIGPHRLYCGDARNPMSYEALLGEDRAAMVFADPPYNVPIGGHVSGLGKTRHHEFVEASGEMSRFEFTAFLRATFRNCTRFSIDGSIHFQCMDWRHMAEIIDAADGVYTQLKQLVVWAKTNAGMGSFYRSQHELLFVFKAGRGRHINNFSLGETGRYRTNVWEYSGANAFRKGRARDLSDRPTVKPVAMVADAIRDCSNRGDLILDPFSGSGTTLIAAHRAGRRGAALELDPLYCDTTVRRLMQASGLDATRADGCRFDELVPNQSSAEAIDG